MPKLPTLFLSHGSPMTALGGDELGRVWQCLSVRLPRPAAILMVSAHWTTDSPLVTGGVRPETIHDFGGFPAELYQLRYPAPGDPALSQRVVRRLDAAGIPASIDERRGFDHGTWVPLLTLFPDLDVPVVQLSVQPGRDAYHHYALGAALAPFSAEKVLIVASGHMTHNLRELWTPGARLPSPESRAFRGYVHERLLDNDAAALLDWTNTAPGALIAHPSSEHFLPLFVALGAAGEGRQTEWLGGGWVEGGLAADNYLFSPRAETIEG